MKLLAVFYFMFCIVLVFVAPLGQVSFPSTMTGLAASIARSLFVGGLVPLVFCVLAKTPVALRWFFAMGMLLQAIAWFTAPESIMAQVNIVMTVIGLAAQGLVLLAVSRKLSKATLTESVAVDGVV